MRRTAIFLFPALTFALGCQTAAPSRVSRPPEFLTSPEAADLSLPFSDAVRAGDFLFVSGQVGNLPGKKELVPGGIGPETARALENIQAILERHGSSMDELVKCTAFLADIREWPALNDVYRRFFPRHFPARSTLAASGLVLDARVEVECVAYSPSPAR